MDLSPVRRFRGRGARVKHVRMDCGERKNKRIDWRVQEKTERKNYETFCSLSQNIGRKSQAVSPHLVQGMFGNGRSSQCCVKSSLGEEQMARRRGDLQKLLALHSRQNVQTVLGGQGVVEGDQVGDDFEDNGSDGRDMIEDRGGRDELNVDMSSTPATHCSFQDLTPHLPSSSHNSLCDNSVSWSPHASYQSPFLLSNAPHHIPPQIPLSTISAEPVFLSSLYSTPKDPF
eukprot:GFUD01023267.1.p1 GENE.GFUD01023267.1~~GFUD01023267.1.p1  ORF type:complete len:230 (+),score=77.99 GFUD01023267.1:64-753(+)